MISVTDKFVKYLIDLNEKQPPTHISKKAKECLLDYIGVTVAGAEISADLLRPYLEYAEGRVPLIGMEKGADALTAAFVNGFSAHVMELDDGHRFGMIHLGASVISAILAAAQKSKLSGDAVLRGIIIGYEAAARLAISIQPAHKQKGFHTAGTCGTIGAAVGTAVALGITDGRLKTVISAAATSAAGLLEIQEDGSQLKAYNTGRAAMDGLNSAYMGLTALRGPEDILDGQRGFGRLLANGIDIEKLTEETTHYEIERIYVKPYAACRHCHSAIEAILSLREHAISPTRIQEIAVHTYRLAIKGHNHTLIQGVGSAKLSMPYSVAAAYILGNCGPDAYLEENLNNPQILELVPKVCICESEAFSQLSSVKRIAQVEIILEDGSRYTKRVDYAKGDPENPMSEAEIIQKYLSLVDGSVFNQKKLDVLESIQNFEQNCTDLYKVL